MANLHMVHLSNSMVHLSIQAFSQDPKRERPILVRYIFSKGAGFEKTFLWKPLKFMLLHISICSKLVRNFSNTLGFVSTEFVPLCFFT